MNVDDFKGKLAEGDKLHEIFVEQRKLMEKYEEIEERNGLLQTKDIPVNLDDRKGQQRIKDFFWRVTEELAEAWQAFEEGVQNHFYEEVADAFHFLVEVCILADYWAEPPIPDIADDCLEGWFAVTLPADNRPVSQLLMGYKVFEIIQALGLAANCLKNKPWKQSHVLTDRDKFYYYLHSAFFNFISFCKSAGLTADSLYNMYFRKNQVNQFRQRSGY